MNDLFVTIAGTHHYMGKSVLKPGTLVLLVKEPDNDYDENAIRVDGSGGVRRVCGQQPAYGDRRHDERQPHLHSMGAPVCAGNVRQGRLSVGATGAGYQEQIIVKD